MNRADFDELVVATIARTGDLLIKKGAEYSDDADRLANFKRNAKKNGHTVLEEWQTYWGKHVDSINSYILRVKDEATKMALVETIALAKDTNVPGGGFNHAISPDRFRVRVSDAIPAAMAKVDETLSESIEGRFDDNINYSLLGQAILKELRG